MVAEGGGKRVERSHTDRRGEGTVGHEKARIEENNNNNNNNNNKIDKK